MRIVYMMLFIATSASLKLAPVLGADGTARPQTVYIDVREPAETASGVVKGAVLLPTSSIRAKDSLYKAVLAKLSKTDRIEVYCAAGVRAAKFADELKAAGFNAFNAGGFADLVKAGKPTTRP